MNSVKVITSHKTFETYCLETFEFQYDNVKINISLNEKKLVIALFGRKSAKKIMDIFFRVYDLIFLILGGFPERESVILNDIEIDTSKWVRKYHTSSHYIEREARLCEISINTVNANTLSRMFNIHNQTLSSLEYIVSDYYSHIVTNHRIELMTHTIDGFLIHTKENDLLLQELKAKYPQKKKVNYIESVERVFRCFFYYHRKNNVQILDCIHLKNKQAFYEVIADTRNDFTHFLESKEHRLIKGRDMVYFIDLIFLANRLFMLKEILNLPVIDEQVKEYMYILHDWIDSIVNKRSDRIKSKRYKQVEKVKESNKCFEEIYEKCRDK